MPVELRKRKAAQPAPEPPAKKKPSAVAKVAAKVKEVVTGHSAKANGSAAAKPTAGGTISLDGFGGEVETHDGRKTSLKALVDESKAGVVLFTYPKASTPGCTKQACSFRDSYAPLTAGGLAIYGLSTDSPKANTSFKEKQQLPYPLLCDPKGTLISAIGLKKAPAGTTRGVFVVDKAGKVLAAEPGSPQGTVDVVQKIVEGMGGGGGGAAAAAAAKTEAAPAPAPAAAAAALPAPAALEAEKPVAAPAPVEKAEETVNGGPKVE